MFVKVQGISKVNNQRISKELRIFFATLILVIALGILLLVFLRERMKNSPPTMPTWLEINTPGNVQRLKKLVEIRGTEKAVFSPIENLLVYYDQVDKVRFMNYLTGEIVQSIDEKSGVRCLAISPDGKFLAICTQFSNVIHLWDISANRMVATLAGHQDSIYDVTFRQDGKRLASASADGTVRIWNVATGSLERILQGHEGWIITVDYSPDGRTLASGSFDGTIRLWDTTTGQMNRVLSTEPNPLDLAYNPVGTRLAAIYTDNSVRIWSVSDGTEVNVFHQDTPGYEVGLGGVAFSPDGRLLAAVSTENTLRIWDTVTMNSLFETRIINALGFYDVQFAPDSKVLAIEMLGYVELWGIPGSS